MTFCSFCRNTTESAKLFIWSVKFIYLPVQYAFAMYLFNQSDNWFFKKSIGNVAIRMSTVIFGGLVVSKQPFILLLSTSYRKKIFFIAWNKAHSSKFGCKSNKLICYNVWYAVTSFCKLCKQLLWFSLMIFLWILQYNEFLIWW